MSPRCRTIQGKFSREARIEAARWSNLRAWLTVEEWSPRTAAYLLLGLDPEQIDYSEQQGWYFVWLPSSPGGAFATMDPHSLDKNIEMEIDRLTDITHRGSDPVKVRRPREWLHWSVSARWEPPWLRAAYSRPSVRRLLPPNLPAAVIDPPVSGTNHQRLTANRKHAKEWGATKKFVELSWRRWQKGETSFPSKSSFATAITGELEQLTSSQSKESGPAVTRLLRTAEVQTILSWIRGWEKDTA